MLQATRVRSATADATPVGPPSPWTGATEELFFRFGPWVFGKWRFASLSNRASPLVHQAGPLQLPPVVQPVTFQQMRDDGTIRRTLSFERRALRYVAFRAKRHFIDLSSGSFDEYMAKFSAKTRNTLRRKVRRFAENSGNGINFRCYTTPEQMIEFRRYAITISLVSYQRKIGWGFPETDEFATHLIDEAGKERVCGFLLMHGGKPVAYVFCRINSQIVTYTLPGYDPEYARLSPGTVLLYLILERLFSQREFRIFDFGGQDWGYKAFFGMSHVDYIRVIWFPITAKNLSLVVVHYFLKSAWSGAARLKQILVRCSRRARAFAAYLPAARTVPCLRRSVRPPA